MSRHAKTQRIIDAACQEPFDSEPSNQGGPSCPVRRAQKRRSTLGPSVYAQAGKATPGKPYAAGACQPMPTDYRGRPVLVLNSHWAVGDDGALQWFLLRRAGDDWHPRRYHVERNTLLRSICELCGAIDATAVTAIRVWPALYRPDALALPTTRAGAADA